MVHFLTNTIFFILKKKKKKKKSRQTYFKNEWLKRDKHKNWLQAISNNNKLVYCKKCRKNFNTLSANPTKWPNTLKQFISKRRAIALARATHAVHCRTCKTLCDELIARQQFSNCAQLSFRK